MVSEQSINDPQHWRFRAEEMRTLAEDMKDKVAREMMLRIATDYDKLAKRAARTTASVAILVPAPGRLSTMNGWPSRSESH
jgi:hypothetical protein